MPKDETRVVANRNILFKGKQTKNFSQYKEILERKFVNNIKKKNEKKEVTTKNLDKFSSLCQERRSGIV